MLCQIVSGGQGFDIKVKSLNLIIKDERYLIDNTNYGSPCIKCSIRETFTSFKDLEILAKASM